MTKQYQSEDIKELAVALAKAQAKIEHAKKSAENPAFKRGNSTTSYADLPAVLDAARPHLAENGLSVIHIPDYDEQGNMQLIIQLTHASGQFIRGWYPIRPVKNDPQGIGSAITYARRYSYCAITGVAAEGEDDDGNEASALGKPKPKQEPLFLSADLRNQFAANCIDAIGKSASAADLKTQKECNLAKWNAMNASQEPADVEAYKKIVAAYNTAFARFKELATAEPKPATVESAKRRLPASVADDEIKYSVLCSKPDKSASEGWR